MVRLLLILVAVVALVFLGLKAFNRIIGGKTGEQPTEQVVDSGEVEPPALPEARTGFQRSVYQAAMGPEDHRVPVARRAAVYVFEHRNAPTPPFQSTRQGNGRNVEDRLNVAIDEATNAWILQGPVFEVEQFERLAKELDKQQTEVDLDFLLVAVNEDVVRSWGITMQFQEGAGWLSALGVTYSGAQLTLGAGDFSISADLTKADSGVRLVSAPVIRCVTGDPWRFSADQQVPIQVLQRGEGVVSTAYEYRSVGLGLTGTIRRAGDRAFRLELEQRNGTVDTASRPDDGEPPQLREQLLQTSIRVEVGRWACAGGVRTWRTENGKGIFGKRSDEAQELLLVFVRPRMFLGGVRPAIPVASGDVEGLEDWGSWGIDGGHPLLPAKPGRPAEKRSLEELEADWLREREDGRPAMGHPQRRIGR